MSIAEKFAAMEYGPAPEDSKEAVAWLDRHGRRFAHFIGGAWQSPSGNAYFETFDPSNADSLASVAQGSPEDVDTAVKAARAASPKWQVLTPHVRAR
jgi:aldehyde dehydrogenase (NAD+)